METSLHRQLKQLYAGPLAQCEVSVGGYRVDVADGARLIEIQHGPLAAIRQKVATLLDTHQVLVVKPVVVRKQIVRRAEQGGEVLSRRQSPKRGSVFDLFAELVHFTRVFPHPLLTLDVPLVEVEQWRYPGQGRRRWGRPPQQSEDQRLLAIHRTYRLRTAADLLTLLPPPPQQPFHTGQLAVWLDVPRWTAQQIAYCLFQTGAVRAAGKQGNTRLYSYAISVNHTCTVPVNPICTFPANPLCRVPVNNCGVPAKTAAYRAQRAVSAGGE